MTSLHYVDLLSGEFPTPSSATMMKSVCCRKTGSLNQRLRFRCGHRPHAANFYSKSASRDKAVEKQQRIHPQLAAPPA
jgi:hypothetical protein